VCVCVCVCVCANEENSEGDGDSDGPVDIKHTSVIKLTTEGLRGSFITPAPPQPQPPPHSLTLTLFTHHANSALLTSSL